MIIEVDLQPNKIVPHYSSERYFASIRDNKYEKNSQSVAVQLSNRHNSTLNCKGQRWVVRPLNVSFNKWCDWNTFQLMMDEIVSIIHS